MQFVHKTDTILLKIFLNHAETWCIYWTHKQAISINTCSIEFKTYSEYWTMSSMSTYLDVQKIQTFHHPFPSWIHFLTVACRVLPYVPFPSVIFFEVSSFLLSYVAPLLSIVPSSLNLKVRIWLKFDYNSVSQTSKYIVPYFNPVFRNECSGWIAQNYHL